MDEVFLSAVEDDVESAVILRNGRHVYITSCARCHSPEPVTAYSRDQWRTILPRMADEAGLSAKERLAVTEYIMAVLTVHERPPATDERVDRNAHGNSFVSEPAS